MKFIKLKASNFKSFKQADIDLDGNGFVKIDGVNNTDSFSTSVGSGKSTIADMLSYALTGETVKGNSSMSDIKNMYSNGTCRVEVEFEHNDKIYVIVRGENELTITEDGVNISKHLKRETQELISQKFPFFTPTFIGATVIIGQNMPNAFTNNKPSARKQILEELTNSSFMIEEIKTMLADKKTEWSAEVGELNTNIVVAETKINSAKQTISRAESKLSELSDVEVLKSQLDEVNQSIAKLTKEQTTRKTQLDEIKAKKDSAQQNVVRLMSELDTAKSKHNEVVMKGVESLLARKSKLESDLAEARANYKSKSEEANKLRAKIEELKSAPTVCPTCKQPLPNAHIIDTTAEEGELENLVEGVRTLETSGISLADEVKKVGAEIDEYKSKNASNEEIDSLLKSLEDAKKNVSKLDEELSDVDADLDRITDSLDEASASKSRLESRMAEVDVVRKSCEEDIKTANEEILNLTADCDELRGKLEKKQAKLSTLNQVISFASRDFRTILLSSIIKRLDAYAKLLCRKMLETDEIEFKDDGNNISITYRGRDFGVLSGGESQIVKMCITLALKKTLEDLVGFTTNIMFFDEVLDNCDKSTAQQIIELVSSLELSSTFFISHHDDVFIPVDQTWTVTKTDRISTLETK